MKFFIYALCDPITFEVRYIGKSNNPHKRYYSHLTIRSLNKKRQTHKIYWLKLLLKQSLLPVQQILEECDENNWEQKECDWIAFYRSIGSDLTNATPGGYCWSESTRKSRKGKKLSEEWKTAISETLKGRKLTDEHKLNISRNHANRGKFGKDSPVYGRHHSEQTKKNMSDAQKLRDPSTRVIRRGWHHSEETKLRIGKSESITKMNRQQILEGKEQILDDYKEGLGIRTISRKYNVLRNAIKRLLLNNNIDIRPSATYSSKNAKKKV